MTDRRVSNRTFVIVIAATVLLAITAYGGSMMANSLKRVPDTPQNAHGPLAVGDVNATAADALERARNGAVPPDPEPLIIGATMKPDQMIRLIRARIGQAGGASTAESRSQFSVHTHIDAVVSRAENERLNQMAGYNAAAQAQWASMRPPASGPDTWPHGDDLIHREIDILFARTSMLGVTMTTHNAQTIGVMIALSGSLFSLLLGIGVLAETIERGWWCPGRRTRRRAT